MTTTRGTQSELITVDYESLVARADLEYAAGIQRSEAGIPVGNGTVGSLLWTSPTVLKFQLNRVDVFANDSETQSFNKRDQDYAGGCGFINIEVARAGPDVFGPSQTEAGLSVYDGMAEIHGTDVSARTIAWQDEDVLAVELEDERDDPEAIAVSLRALRPAEVRTKHHTATSTVHASDDRIALVQRFEEGDFFCSSAIAVGMFGRSANPIRVSDTHVKLVAPAGTESLTIYLASAATFDPEEDVIAAATAGLAKAREHGFAGIHAANEPFWEDYWSRSFVSLQSDDDTAECVEHHYTYFQYLMAACSRGPYPPNFGGLLWNTAGDERRWGAQQWWTNLSIYYRGLFPTDRIELTDPLFALYSGMRPSCATAARQQWGSQGIYIPETCWFDGLAELPADIAAELCDLYLLKRPWETRSSRFRAYAATKHPHTSRWNWKAHGRYRDGHWTYTDKGTGPFADVNHFFASGPELAALYWKRYAYTQDEDWLSEHAYPMLRGVIEFFRHYPHLTVDQQGSYHLHHVNHSEPVLGATDPFDALVGFHGVLPLAIKAATILEVDAELRTEWQDLLDRIAPLPTSDHPDAIDDHDGNEPVWVSGLYPAVTAPEDALQLDVRARFCDVDIATLEGDTTDCNQFKRAVATYEHAYPDGIHEDTRVRVMASLATVAARLGRAADVKWALYNQLRVPWPEEDFVEYETTGDPAVLPNRMTLREGTQALGAQRLGNVTYGLHEALLQSVPARPGGEPVIRVFPGWPPTWDAAFTLAARGDVLVTAACRDDEVQFVELRARTGGPCRIRNPWGDDGVDVYRDGNLVEDRTGERFTFKPKPDESIVLVPTGITPADRAIAVE